MIFTTANKMRYHVIDVCHAGELYTGPVDLDKHHQDDGVEIKLWYSNGTKFGAECYFWCTQDGSIPRRKLQNLDVSELLSGEFRVSPIKMGTNDSQPQDISPMTVYFTNQGFVFVVNFIAENFEISARISPTLMHSHQVCRLKC